MLRDGRRVQPGRTPEAERCRRLYLKGPHQCCLRLLLPALDIEDGCAKANSFARVLGSGYVSSIPKRGRKEQLIPMTQNSRYWKCSVAIALATFVLVVQAGLMAQDLGTAPAVNVAVQGEQATQPEGTFLNLINWIGNVIAPVGAGGAALMAIGSFAMGRGFAKWVFTAIGLLMVSGVTRLLEYWIAQGTAGVT